MIARWIANRLVYKIFEATGKPGERPENSRFLWIWITVLLVGLVALFFLK